MNEYPAVKKVNIYPQRRITTINPPIGSTVRRTTRTVEDIRKCIIARARVEEILPDGSVIALDFSNYNKDNRPSTTATETAKVEKVAETAKINAAEVAAQKKAEIEAAAKAAEVTATEVAKETSKTDEVAEVKEETKKETETVETKTNAAPSDEELDVINVDDLLGDDTAAEVVETKDVEEKATSVEIPKVDSSKRHK